MESNLPMLRHKSTRKSSNKSYDAHQLSDLDNSIDSLLSTGKLLNALEFINQAVQIRLNLYSQDSAELINFISLLLQKSSNACAVLIEVGHTQECIEFLRKVLELSTNYPLTSLVPETCEAYNTLSCALRKSAKVKLAKKYAMKALGLAITFKVTEQLSASIHLNLCAIYSALNNHKQAALYCSQAIQLSQEHLVNLKLTKQIEEYKQEIAVLAVAYHNLGVEEEHLENYEESLGWYKKAILFLEKHPNPYHQQMLEEFKRNFEDAQRNYLGKIRVGESFDDYGVFIEKNEEAHDESSLTLNEFIVEKQLGAVEHRGNRSVPRIRGFGRFGQSNSSSSAARLTIRKKSVGSVSDIKDLGCESAAHKSSSRRNSFHTGGLSPINKALNSMRKPNKKAEIASDYQESAISKRKSSESSRKRKIIREPPKRNTDNILNAVVMIQRWFRLNRHKKWFKEFQNWRIIGKVLKCEKIIDNEKYLVTFLLKKCRSSICVRLEAQPLSNEILPEPAKYLLFEACSILNAWSLADFELKKPELLLMTSIENGRIFISKDIKRKMQLCYQQPKQLNNMLTYQILVYNISDYQSEESFLITAKPLKKSQPISRVFILSHTELASILNINLSEINSNLSKLIDLVIIEGEGEISLKKRSINEECPLISIHITHSDDYIDKYKQYEIGNKADAEPLKKLVFDVGKSKTTSAALLIQKNFKGAKERKKFNILKEMIQSLGLSCSVSTLNRAILVLKRFTRRWKAKKLREGVVLTREDKAIILLQSHTRGWLIRKKFPGLVNKELLLTKAENRFANAALQLQARMRRLKAKAKIKSTKRTIFESVVIIKRNLKKWLNKIREKRARSRQYLFKYLSIWIKNYILEDLKSKNIKKYSTGTKNLLVFQQGSVKRERIAKPKIMPEEVSLEDSTRTIISHSDKKHISLNLMNLNPNMVKKTGAIKDFRAPSANSIVRITSPEVSVKRRENPRIKFESSNQMNFDISSPDMTPTVALSNNFDKSSMIISQDFNKIVMKTGFRVSGIYLIITMSLMSDGIFISAKNESGLIKLDLIVKVKREKLASEKEVEGLCAELLVQLKIVSNIEGKMKLAIIDFNDECREEVIYRRSHFISGRYFTVTIYETYRGVYLNATENEINTFHMRLGQKPVGNSQKVQEELADLVKRLKISVVLGQEMLVISSI